MKMKLLFTIAIISLGAISNALLLQKLLRKSLDGDDDN